MKKIYTLSLVLCVILSCNVFAGNIPSGTAQKAAKTFYSRYSGFPQVNLSLAFTENSDAGIPVYYIFNTSNDKGFVIISANEAAEPVLGYSLEGTYKFENLNCCLKSWMGHYKNEISYLQLNHTEASDDLNSHWGALIDGTWTPPTAQNVVSPLVATTWDQMPYYNDQCPYDAGASEHAVTGCVATCMAQIMKYWHFPTTGIGSTTYNDATYGAQSANFAATTYNWASMPNAISSANSNIAKLMYQCGVGVNMNYGTASSGGSGAQVISADDPVCAQAAFVDYFGYDWHTIQGLYESSYSDANWHALIMRELDNSRPVEYVGRSASAGGHTWVCDGYSTTGSFHMNWGWGGSDNGYFALNACDPASLGAGGGSGGFDYSQEALIGIEPGTTTTDVVPDVYENNNAESSPRSFNLNWTNNLSERFTYGSNIHVATDADYYKISLPAGYFYWMLYARVNDSQNSNDGNVYTNNVDLSYNTGASWSNPYPTAIPDSIGFHGATTLLFKVASTTPGTLGTYLLDVKFLRKADVTGVSEMSEGQTNFIVFPSLASDRLNLLFDEAIGNQGKIRFINNLGETVKELSGNEISGTGISTDVSSLPSGIYFVSIQSEKVRGVKKIVIAH